MSDEVLDSLKRWIADALSLRYTTELPEIGAAPQTVLESLRECRRNLDRVEEILGRAVRLRAHAQRLATHAGNVFDDAWDQAAQDRRTAPVLRGGEFSSARERHAEANLATIDLRQTARAAADTAHRCDEAVDVLRLAHRGLEGVRQDHLAILRSLQFESTIDR